MDIEQARRNMIESQIRTWEVLDPTVLELIESVPREDFVPPEYRALSFSDTHIPIGHGEVMMTPKFEARMLQALSVEQTDRALEIGTGTGFVTALLTRLASSVVSIDIREDFISRATRTLADAGIRDVDLRVADGARGYIDDGTYDVVAVTGSLPIFDSHFLDMLSVGGRLFVVVGTAPVMEAMLLTKLSDSDWSQESLFETELAPLLGAPQPDGFVF